MEMKIIYIYVGLFTWAPNSNRGQKGPHTDTQTFWMRNCAAGRRVTHGIFKYILSQCLRTSGDLGLCGLTSLQESFIGSGECDWRRPSIRHLKRQLSGLWSGRAWAEVYHFLQQPFTSALHSSPNVSDQWAGHCSGGRHCRTGKRKKEWETEQNGGRIRVKAPKFALSPVPSE